jgi:transposase
VSAPGEPYVAGLPAKQMEFAREIVPGARRVGLLTNLQDPKAPPQRHELAFVVLPRRWLVERTFAWLNRCRRLAKDWENLNRNALAFVRLASIRLMLRKLCNPA